MYAFLLGRGQIQLKSWPTESHWNFAWFLFLTRHIFYLQNVVKTEPLVKTDCVSLWFVSIYAGRNHRAMLALPFHRGYRSVIHFQAWTLCVCTSSPTNLSPVAGNHFEQNDTFFEGLSVFSTESWSRDIQMCPPAWAWLLWKPAKNNNRWTVLFWKKRETQHFYTSTSSHLVAARNEVKNEDQAFSPSPFCS